MSAVPASAARPNLLAGDRLFRRLGGLVRPWRWLLALTALFVLLSALLELVPPLVVQRIIDDNIAAGRSTGLVPLAVLYLAATSGVQGMTFLYGYLAALVAQNLLHVLRVRLFGHFEQLPMRYYDQTPLGDTISRCTADVETVDTLFSSGVASLVAETTRMVTVGVAMLVLSAWLFLIACCIAPPLAFITRELQLRIRDAERENRRAVGLLNTHLQETLAGTEVVRAFAAEPLFVARFRAALRQTLLAGNRSTFFNALYPPITGILASIVTALLLWFGARDVFASLRVSLGTLTAFVLLFQRFFTPLINLGDQWQTVQSALSGVERIFEALDLPVEQPASREGSHRLNPRRAAELRGVEFGYLPGRPVLKRVSLEVRRGEHLAIVGRTGAGKSSTLHLLGGLYAPWNGSVRVAGRNPRSLDEEERRRLLGVVPQAVHLFGGTLLDNLSLHDATVARADVERAVAISGLDPLIQSLPRGYDTPLSGAGRGEGAQLSAGQRQLLALARALVCNPELLLLDEATAAIDGASDAALRAALRTAVLSRGCAVLTVAHRLATACEADRVVVMEAGRIVEEGAPAALIAANGRFAALIELEAAGWDRRTLGHGKADAHWGRPKE